MGLRAGQCSAADSDLPLSIPSAGAAGPALVGVASEVAGGSTATSCRPTPCAHCISSCPILSPFSCTPALLCPHHFTRVVLSQHRIILFNAGPALRAAGGNRPTASGYRSIDVPLLSVTGQTYRLTKGG